LQRRACSLFCNFCRSKSSLSGLFQFKKRERDTEERKEKNAHQKRACFSLFFSFFFFEFKPGQLGFGQMHSFQQKERRAFVSRNELRTSLDKQSASFFSVSLFLALVLFCRSAFFCFCSKTTTNKKQKKDHTKTRKLAKSEQTKKEKSCKLFRKHTQVVFSLAKREKKARKHHFEGRTKAAQKICFAKKSPSSLSFKSWIQKPV
jgi:hypothetical protein